MSKIDLLITLLQEAVDKCYADDTILIDRSMEQASVARIFYYMQKAIDTDDRFEQFREYNLDCEYNKDKKKPKSTPRCNQGTRPDLVLHKRWNTGVPYTSDNVLVVEFKPRKARYKKFADTNKSIDFIKLEDFTHMDCYNYFLGVFVKLNKNTAQYTYFQNGQETAREDLSDE